MTGKGSPSMSADTVPFSTIPEPPATVSAGAILGRLADAVGFRFRWATENIQEADLPFKPAADCWSLAQLIDHIHELLEPVAKTIGARQYPPLAKPASSALLRARVLDLSAGLSARFKAMSDADLAGASVRNPTVWIMVNGHLADILTHIGQILSWRRIAGSPPAAPDLFQGLPPRE